MTTVFSKHSNLPNVTEKPQASAKTSELDKLDVDLIDKIKTAITRLKTTQQRKRKINFETAKFPCSICEKNCNNNQDAIFCTHCEGWVHRKCNAT